MDVQGNGDYLFDMNGDGRLDVLPVLYTHRGLLV